MTDGTQRRDYLHVADVAEALCRIAESDLTDRVDICTGEPVRLRDVFEAIARATGRAELIRTGALAEQRADGMAGHGRPDGPPGHRLAAALQPAARDPETPPNGGQPERGAGQ